MRYWTALSLEALHRMSIGAGVGRFRRLPTPLSSRLDTSIPGGEDAAWEEVWVFAKKPSEEGSKSVCSDVAKIACPATNEEVLSRLDSVPQEVGDAPVVQIPGEPRGEEEVLKLVQVVPVRLIGIHAIGEATDTIVELGVGLEGKGELKTEVRRDCLCDENRHGRGKDGIASIPFCFGKGVKEDQIDLRQIVDVRCGKGVADPCSGAVGGAQNTWKDGMMKSPGGRRAIDRQTAEGIEVLSPDPRRRCQTENRDSEKMEETHSI